MLCNRCQLIQEFQVSNILNEESLKAGDLRGLVSHVFEIDSFKSKMGEDEDVVTLSFTVDTRGPAEDLVNFLEKGYETVLDADMSPGELSNGKYKVFVEIARTRTVAQTIMDILYGLGQLTNIEKFKFRYYKSFNSEIADLETLTDKVPQSAKEYNQKTSTQQLENFQNFFNRSYLESIDMLEDTIEFKRIYGEPVKFKFVKSGAKNAVLESIEEKISMLPPDISEVMFLTKYIGNYNITKFGNKLMFENKDYAIVLEKL